MSAGEIDLLPGERVLWAGEPVQRPLYVAADGVIAPAGLVLAALALWFLLANEPSGAAMTAAVVVLVIGLYGAVGQLAHPVPRARAHDLRRDRQPGHRALGPVPAEGTRQRVAGLSEPVLKPGPSRTGTLSFGPGAVTADLGVGKPKRVRDLLTKAIGEAKARQAPPETGTSAA